MTTKTSTYPLRLPISIKAEAERLAAADGTSLPRPGDEVPEGFKAWAPPGEHPS
jgi:hypothetical protein